MAKKQFFPIEDAEAVETTPPHQLLHAGNKLFWRVNRTIDFRIFASEAAGAVVLRSYDSSRDCEFPPLVIRLDAILTQLVADDAAQSALQASLVAVDTSKKAHEEDEVVKERRRQKEYAEKKREAVKRRSEAQGSAGDKVATKKEQVDQVERDRSALKEKGEMLAKVVSFCISRLEVEKDAATGAVTTKLVKRPNDAVESLEFLSPGEIADCGWETAWNRKESSSRIIRKASELVVAVEETNASTVAAGQRQRATVIALDIFSSIADRAHLEALPKHQQKFHAVLKKALFQRRLESMQENLKASPAYQEFTKSLAR